MLKLIVYKGKNQLKMLNRILELNSLLIRWALQFKIKQNLLVKDNHKIKKFS